MTAGVAPETEEHLADHWLDTGGIPVVGAGGTKSYPKRSELRRAEARRQSQTRPGRGRTDSQRPVGPTPVPRSPRVTRPTPAAGLPIPRSVPSRPAGINIPLPQPSPADAFHRPPTATAPIELDLGGISVAERPARSKRLTATATRLLVMALVVGGEGVAVTQLADFSPSTDSDSSLASSAFALSDAEETAAAQEEADAAEEAQQLRAKTVTTELTNVKDGSSAKADAATAQAKKAKAAAEKEAKAKAAAAKKKKEAAAKAKAKAEAEAKAKAAAEAEAAEEAASDATSVANARENPQAAAKVLLTDRGWSSAQYTCLDSLWTRESNWNYQATNASSGAYGIPQALPGSKMASAGSDWKTNPVTQIRWGLDYIAERYGTPCGAWEHSESVGWY